MTFFTPYLSSNGFSVIANPVVVQFGRGATQPFQLRFFFWVSSNSACSSLIPGIRIGTSSSYLYAELVEITGKSAAIFVSISLAATDSTAENTRSNCDTSRSSIFLTVIDLMYSGISPPTSQATIPLASLIASR